MGLIKPKDNNGTCPGGWWIGGFNFGFEHTTVQVAGQKYLSRWIVYLLGYTLRLHKFYCGDDMRAFHDHPWPFWTFPLCSGYWETVPGRKNWVPGWRPSYRSSSYRHIVMHPPKPFWTIVVTGRKDRGWGFWQEVSFGEYLRDIKPGSIFSPPFYRFVPWREWK